MASSGGHLLVPKALRLIKFAVERATQVVRDKLPQAAKAIEAELQPVYARNASKLPIHRAAAIRQTQSRWYSTKQTLNSTVRHFSSNAETTASHGRVSHPASRTARAVSQVTSRAPFASTLRPSLTGGTLSRTAGGYSTGAGRVGGARYFSHTPAAPAQVVQNVSQAVRAFWLSGQKARFDGTDPRTGEKRFRAVSDLQDKTHRKLDVSNASMPGSYLDFKINPTITAMGPLSNIPRPSQASQDSLTSEGLLDALSVDFARTLKDLAAVMNDLKRLAKLGDLPISLPNSTTLRVRFPGCDADSVEALCQELGIRRGLLYQDEDFESFNGTELALLFPFAPSNVPSEASYRHETRPPKRHKRDHVEWEEMLSPARRSSPGLSPGSVLSHEFEELEGFEEHPGLSSPSGYSSLHESEQDELGLMFNPGQSRTANRANDFEGLEGIYRFIEECDRARR